MARAGTAHDMMRLVFFTFAIAVSSLTEAAIVLWEEL